MSARAEAPLPRGMLLAFTLPTLVLGFTHGPEGQIQAIYAKHAGLSLTALAAALLLGRILDGITYPLVGYLSDRTYARTGSRKLWVIAGTVVSMVGMWFLFRPPADVTVVHFGAWMAVVYVGWKLMEIPLLAWSYGLSTDYVQRGRVQAWRALGLMGGQLMFFATPYLAVVLGYSDSTELDFRALGVAAVVCAAALPLATLIAVRSVPDGRGSPPVARRRFGLRQTFNAVRHNGPLLHLIAAFLPVNLLGGMAFGVSYLYIDTYLGLGKQYAAIMMVSLPASLLGIPFWTALAARYERHCVLAVALVTAGLACACFAFVSPGPYALPASFVLYPAVMFGIAGTVIVFTMSADIVDYGRLQSGEDHGGLYAALLAFLQKSLMGAAAAAGLALVGVFGFDATAATQSATAALGIKLAATLLPALGLFAAAAIIWNYSLTRERLAGIRAALPADCRQMLAIPS
jgi:glycoside/pentoside/hexuronide:cation symporter, GPH family